jgi:RNA polymerase sigma factor (sigma-70 family)
MALYAICCRPAIDRETLERTDVVHADPPSKDGEAVRLHNSRRSPDLENLLRRAGRNDWAAWGELVNRFGRLVMYTAGTIDPNFNDAADAAQLTWLRLHEHISEIREPEHLPAWLVVTARREALRIALGAKRYVLCAEPSTDYATSRNWFTADTYPIEGDYSPDMEAALRSLPTRYEQLLRLLMCDDCPSYTEVSEKLGIPIGSIGPMRMRALEILRRQIQTTSTGLPADPAAA